MQRRTEELANLIRTGKLNTIEEIIEHVKQGQNGDNMTSVLKNIAAILDPCIKNKEEELCSTN